MGFMLGTCYQTLCAQTSCPQNIIRFTYDQAGNRIKRELTVYDPCSGSGATASRSSTLPLIQANTLPIAVSAQNAATDDATNTVAESTETQPLTWEKQVCVYPNPVQTEIHIQTNGVPVAQVQVWSTDGKMMRTVAQPQAQYSIDVQAYPAGTYYIHITTTDGKQNNWTIVKQ